jgi:hypothetical protein
MRPLYYRFDPDLETKVWDDSENDAEVCHYANQRNWRPDTELDPE